MSRTTLEEKLKALPDTPDEIAEFLTARGFSGRRGSCYRCPIANYLGSHLAVKIDKIILNIDTDQHLEVPEAVSEFICRFDSGRYPKLIEVHIPF